MRKPRDYDSELKALDDKARVLRERKVTQLGELVIAAGADILPLEQLAGALLDVAAIKDNSAREAWRTRGAAMFQRKARGAGGDGGGAATADRSAPPAPGKAGA